MVSLANNHVLDYGAGAFREMLPVLDSAGILHAGAGLDRDAARRPAVRRVSGTAVGLIAFTDNQPDWEADRGPGVFYVPVVDSDRQGGGAAGPGPADEGPRRAPDRLRALGAELGHPARRPSTASWRGPSSRRAPTSSTGTRRTSSAVSRCSGTGRSSTAPGTSWTTTRWIRSSATTSRSFSCSTPTAAHRCRFGCIPTLITGFPGTAGRQGFPADRGTDAAAQPAPRDGQQLGRRRRIPGDPAGRRRLRLRPRRLRGPDLPVHGRHDLGGKNLDGPGGLGKRQAPQADLGQIAAGAERVMDFQ